ncbi:Uncharacterised protein [BD1-7 clade bacterium]|nr:Uncharacterised protein [BD1-7 clade bacterium]
MSADPFLGEIQPFGFNFNPRGWALCQGQLLPISQNTALFSLLGTTYGGDGRTTFGLPDLRGRSMVGVGSGPGLDTIAWGERGGANEITLTVAQLPAHSHIATLHAETKAGDANNPQNKLLAITSTNIYTTPDPASNKTMHPESIVVNNAGAGLPFSIDSPYLGVYIGIALLGIYPSRS